MSFSLLWSGCCTIRVPKPPVNGKNWIKIPKQSLSPGTNSVPRSLGPTLLQFNIISQKLISVIELYQKRRAPQQCGVCSSGDPDGEEEGGKDNLRAAPGVASFPWLTLSGLTFDTLWYQTAMTETIDKSPKSSVPTQVVNSTFYSILSMCPSYIHRTQNPKIS